MMTTRLADGRFASVAQLEVLRIPDESVISDRFDDESPTEGMRDEFAQLITEVASLREVLGSLGSVTAEAVWGSTPVGGQLYAAEPRFPKIDDTLLDMIWVYFLRHVQYETDLDLPPDYLSRVLTATTPRAEEQS